MCPEAADKCLSLVPKLLSERFLTQPICSLQSSLIPSLLSLLVGSNIFCISIAIFIFLFYFFFWGGIIFIVTNKHLKGRFALI